jgi:hypothetical protein
MKYGQAMTLRTTFTVAALLLLAVSAFAQTSTGDDSAEQPVDEHHNAVGEDPGTGSDHDRMALHDRIRDRIHDAPGLSTTDRRQMMQHLDTCLQLGLRDDQIEGLFPMGGSDRRMNAQDLMTAQEQVIRAAHSGMPADLLADKFREGRMKGAAPEAIGGAMHRMEEHMVAAHQQMNHAIANGVTPSGDEWTDRHLHRGLALDMWRGLSDDDLEVLRDHAMQRISGGECSIVEFAAAAETTTEFIEQGVAHQRSRHMVGTSLEQGYSAEEMRQLGQMMRSAGGHGGPTDEMLTWMEQHMAGGEHMDDMTQQMIHMGWLGPRDMHGPGGHSPVDDVMGGPGHPGSGHMGGGDHGGDMQGPGSGSGHDHGSGSMSGSGN